MKVSAKSVVIELLSAGPGVLPGSIPVRLLVRAASIFDIAENSVRVAIVRLRAEGLLESPQRGEYRLGPAAQAIDMHVHRWQNVDTRLGTWDGSWIGVFTANLSRTDRPALRRRQRALRFLGFEELKQGFFLRPNNLTLDAAAIHDELTDLGLDPEVPVFRANDFVEREEKRIRSLWDTANLEGVYDDMTEHLQASLERLEKLPIEDSVKEHFLLGREGIRWVALDPLLPAPLIDESKRNAFFEVLRGYNERGLALWGEFLAED